MDTLIETIIELEKEAILKDIKTNAVFINENCDFCKELYLMFDNKIAKTPPMILGKKMFLIDMPEPYTIALAEVQEDPTELELLKKENESLKAQLREIKEILGVTEDDNL